MKQTRTFFILAICLALVFIVRPIIGGTGGMMVGGRK
jgi:hypothetical protein